MKQNLQHREALKNARRIVVKAGSKVLVQRTGKPDQRRIGLLTEELAQVQNDGGELVFVSSGAIGAGLEIAFETRGGAGMAQGCKAGDLFPLGSLLRAGLCQ